MVETLWGIPVNEEETLTNLNASLSGHTKGKTPFAPKFLIPRHCYYDEYSKPNSQCSVNRRMNLLSRRIRVHISSLDV